MGVAYIRGMQARGVGACIKHYLCNDQEFERNSISSKVSERPLREIYLPPFEAAVKDAGVLSVMTSYNRINGTYASGLGHPGGSRYTANRALRPSPGHENQQTTKKNQEQINWANYSCSTPLQNFM